MVAPKKPPPPVLPQANLQDQNPESNQQRKEPQHKRTVKTATSLNPPEPSTNDAKRSTEEPSRTKLQSVVDLTNDDDKESKTKKASEKQTLHQPALSKRIVEEKKPRRIVANPPRRKKRAAAKSVLAGASCRPKGPYITMLATASQNPAFDEKNDPFMGLPRRVLQGLPTTNFSNQELSRMPVLYAQRLNEVESFPDAKPKAVSQSTVKRKRGRPRRSSPSRKKSRGTPLKSPSRVPGTVCPPPEDIKGGWPPGWKKMTSIRQGGVTKGRNDYYWFSPKKDKKLTSIRQVERFLSLLSQNKGDEDAAWVALKKST